MKKSMKVVGQVRVGKEPYINLNYKGRKAVINLSLKQLEDITGTDKDIDDYPYIFDNDMFLEYPKQLKVRVLLERDYNNLVSNAEQYQTIKQELETKTKNTEALVSQMTKRQDKIQQLQEQLKSKDTEITKLKEQNTSNEKELTKLKTSIEYISNHKNTVESELKEANKQLDALKMKSLTESINTEREYERLLYELKSHSKWMLPFKIDKWIDKFLDQLHLQELQRTEHESIEGDTEQEQEQ